MMAMKFFETITDVKELKREYIRLLKQWHPDNFLEDAAIAKAVQVTQDINNQYEHRLAYLKEQCTDSSSAEQQKQDYYYWKFDDEFRKVINVLASCSWISDIELCGCFLWFKVDYKHKSKLKDLTLDFPIRYAPRKKLFFVCLNREYQKKNFQEMDMNHIRDVYGSQKFSKSDTSDERFLQAQ